MATVSTARRESGPQTESAMNYAIFMITLAAASLAACGQSEEAPVPVAPVTEAAAPQTGQAALTTAEALAPPPASSAAPLPEAVPAMTPSPAETQAASAAAKPDLAHGQQIYRQACAFCHDKGVAGAPKAGDPAAWSPRLAQGMDALYAAALRGKGAMPAKGGNPSLADADVKAAADYLAAQAR
jgi:cytochrome c5